MTKGVMHGMSHHARLAHSVLHYPVHGGLMHVMVALFLCPWIDPPINLECARELNAARHLIVWEALPSSVDQCVLWGETFLTQAGSIGWIRPRDRYRDPANAKGGDWAFQPS